MKLTVKTFCFHNQCQFFFKTTAVKVTLPLFWNHTLNFYRFFGKRLKSGSFILILSESVFTGDRKFVL